jgi:hypothetical protein
MRTGWIVNLLLLIGVAGLAAYAIYGRKGEDLAQYPIAALAGAEVTRIAIEPRTGARMLLEKQGQDWFLAEPLRARADRIQVERLLDLLSARSKEKLAATELQRFDLDKPVMKVTFNDQAIAFGMTNPLTQDQYALSGDGVYLLSAYYSAMVPQNPARILTHALFRPDEKPSAFVLKGLRIEQRDGNWQLTPAPRDPQAKPSQDELNHWVDDWRLASSLLTQPASGKVPVESIDVRLADGRTLTLGVLQREPELVLVRPDEKLAFYFSSEMARRLLAAPETAPAPVRGAASGVAPQ